MIPPETLILIPPSENLLRARERSRFAFFNYPREHTRKIPGEEKANEKKGGRERREIRSIAREKRWTIGTDVFQREAKKFQRKKSIEITPSPLRGFDRQLENKNFTEKKDGTTTMERY